MFTLTAPLQGTYLVYVNYWGNFGSEGYNFDGASNQNEVITSPAGQDVQLSSIPHHG
jgi:uncharacterized protein YfaP (DUF2135 family)